MKKVNGKFDPYKDWVMDPRGYFLIRINLKLKRLELGHCSKMPKKAGKHRVDVMISGKTPQDVYFTAAKLGLMTRFDHASYLGKELEKAYVAMQLGLKYVQDDELLKTNTKTSAIRAKRKMKGKK